MRRSISDRMYRIAVLAMCVSDQTLVISKYRARPLFLHSRERSALTKRRGVCDDGSRP